MGSDNIPTKFLRILIPVILPTITHIINHSIICSIFPIKWKTAVITPIPKKQNADTVNDFRPISILCTLSKIFDKILSIGEANV